MNAKKSQENKYEDIPIFKSPDEMQAYFLKEVQLGDAAMATGDMQEAIIHFANATVVCTQKSYFLDAMQKSLPAPMFQVLYQQYRIVNDVSRIVLKYKINYFFRLFFLFVALFQESPGITNWWLIKVKSRQCSIY